MECCVKIYIKPISWIKREVYLYVVCVCAHVIQQQWKFLSFPTQSSQHRRPLQSTYFWHTSQTLRSMSPKLPTLPHIYTLHCQSPPPPINNPFLNTKNSIFLWDLTRRKMSILLFNTLATCSVQVFCLMTVDNAQHWVKQLSITINQSSCWEKNKTSFTH